MRSSKKWLFVNRRKRKFDYYTDDILDIHKYRNKIFNPIFLKYTNHEKRIKELYDKMPERKKLMIRYIFNRKQKHRLHMVSPSPWPIYSAASAFLLVIGMVLWMHRYTGIPLLCGVISVISAFTFWFRDIIREGLYMGYHTKKVCDCLRTGFVLFLISEVMFFFGFFWALLHYTLTPSIFHGGVWPPQGIVLHILCEDVFYPASKKISLLKSINPLTLSESHHNNNLFYDNTDYHMLLKRCRPQPYTLDPSTHYKEGFDISSSYIDHFFTKWAYKYYSNNNILFFNPTKLKIHLYSHGVLVNPYKIPLLNTAILVTSGFLLTLSHTYLRLEYFRASYRFLLATILFGLYFILLQSFEYTYSGFSINDGVYGSIFYLLTGFHGFHVIVGTTYLIIVAIRMRFSHFTANNHLAFETAAWYWHFVDVVWILLYFLLYLWPNWKYFVEYSTISYYPKTSTFAIEMTVKFFFEKVNLDSTLHIPCDINFEYAYSKKIKVVSTIIDYFAKELVEYSYDNSKILKRIKSYQLQNFVKHNHISIKEYLTTNKYKI